MPGTPTQLMRNYRRRVLVVDENAIFAETIAEGLEMKGFDALRTTSSRDAARTLEQDAVDALVTNLRMKSLDGIDLLAISRRASPSRPVILMAEYGSVDTAIAAMRKGAYHYLIKPFLLEELAVFLERALEETVSSQPRSKLGPSTAAQHSSATPVPRPMSSAARQSEASPHASHRDSWDAALVGSSHAMQNLRDLLERVADASASVLISGETGTGKNAVARAIHARGTRANAPLLTVHCSARSEDDVQRDLFAKVQGAAGDDDSTTPSLLERANGGTLFLDDVSELSLPLQAMLLHVLESKTADVRILAATRANLRERVAERAFREDLLYRLDVVSVEIPPLRDHSEDIPELVARFLVSVKSRHPDSMVECFSARALDRLRDYPWPGNVRELEHCVEHAVLLARTREVGVEQLPPTLAAMPPFAVTFHGEVVPLREIGQRYVRWAYERLGGKKLLAAERLQIDNKTLNKMLVLECNDGADDSQGTG